MGRDSNDELKVVVRSVGSLDRENSTPAIALENGDIAVGDVNNDGFNDFSTLEKILMEAQLLNFSILMVLNVRV